MQLNGPVLKVFSSMTFCKCTQLHVRHLNKDLLIIPRSYLLPPCSQLSLLPLSLVSVNYSSAFCYCRLVCIFWSFFCKWTHPVITFLEGYIFFHCLFHDSSLSLHISAVYFFLLIDGILLCRCTICLSHSPFDGHLIISSLGLLQIKMLQTFMNKSLYEQMLLSLLGKYLGMKWLDHMVRICLIF